VVGYQQGAWATAYLVMAVSCCWRGHRAVVARACARAFTPAATLEWLQTALIEPFADFAPLRQAGVVILALIAVYRISDVVMGIMANPFYVDMATPRTKWPR
jgi:PAT family beta-lactamase induction signal transducer AmpG